jgi:hypothetical protein
LVLIADLRHVLTSQLHRRFNPGRAATTTQRRLKRLSDAGLLERFQFHRRDGGGVPMCCAITAAGRELLAAAGRSEADPERGAAAVQTLRTGTSTSGEQRLRQARHDVHVTGWALALAGTIGEARARLCGPGDAVLSPPMRSTPSGRIALAPGDLRLPGGRVPHDFLRTNAAGERPEVERFETVRPDVILEVRGSTGAAREERAAERERIVERRSPATDLIVEVDDRLPLGLAAAKLERYDHFLGGWSVHTARYGRRQEAVPVVVFVCRDRSRARACAQAADPALRACRAYAGEYPFDWEYPGRDRILFASERDVHEGLLRAYGVPRLPPEVRVIAAHGDPRAGEAILEARAILP